MPVCSRCKAVILDQTPDNPAGFGLSLRQIDVLLLLGDGLGNKDMGRALGISPATVKLHVQQLLKKLGATNRLQVVVTAYRHGLLPRPATPVATVIPLRSAAKVRALSGS